MSSQTVRAYKKFLLFGVPKRRLICYNKLSPLWVGGAELSDWSSGSSAPFLFSTLSLYHISCAISNIFSIFFHKSSLLKFHLVD
nr:MAG TPA: hypothetical protein [Caudoviricetes sp.]